MQLLSCLIEKYSGFTVISIEHQKKTKETIQTYRYNLQKILR